MLEVNENDKIPEFEERNYDSVLMDIEINEEKSQKLLTPWNWTNHRVPIEYTQESWKKLISV